MSLRNNTNGNWIAQNYVVVCMRSGQKVQLQLGAYWGKREMERKPGFISAMQENCKHPV